MVLVKLNACIKIKVYTSIITYLHKTKKFKWMKDLHVKPDMLILIHENMGKVALNSVAQMEAF